MSAHVYAGTGTCSTEIQERELALHDADIFGDQPKGEVLTFETSADPRIVREVADAVERLEAATLDTSGRFDGAILVNGTDNSVLWSKYPKSFAKARDPFERVLLKWMDVSLYAASLSAAGFPIQPFALQVHNNRMRLFIEREGIVHLAALQLLRPPTARAGRIGAAVDRLINRAHFKCTFELGEGVDPSWNEALERELLTRFSLEIEASKLHAPSVRKTLKDVTAVLDLEVWSAGAPPQNVQDAEPFLSRLVEGD